MDEKDDAKILGEDMIYCILEIQFNYRTDEIKHQVVIHDLTADQAIREKYRLDQIYPDKQYTIVIQN